MTFIILIKKYKGDEKMAANTKVKKGRLLGREAYAKIDPETGELTGEVIEADVVERNYTRNGFVIAYMSAILLMIDKLGNQKLKVVKYILEKMDMYNNMLIETVEEICQGSGVSRPTVTETLQLLEEVGIIKRKIGIIYVSPKLINRGSQQKERYMMVKFSQIPSKADKEKVKEDQRLYLASNNFDKIPAKKSKSKKAKSS